jgi:hypothetical protein
LISLLPPELCELRNPHEFDTPVAGASFDRIVRVFGLPFAESRRREMACIDLVLFHQSVSDGARASFGKVEVFLVITNAVGVSCDAQFPIGMFSQDVRDFFQSWFGLVSDLIAVERKVNA